MESNIIYLSRRSPVLQWLRTYGIIVFATALLLVSAWQATQIHQMMDETRRFGEELSHTILLRDMPYYALNH